MNSVLDLLPAIILLAVLAGYIVIWYISRNFGQVQKHPDRVAEIGPRAPGETSNIKIDKTNREIKFNLALMLTIPLVLLGSHASYIYWFADTSNSLVGLIVWGVGVGVIFFYLLKSLKLIRKRKLLRMGYRSELTVGEALNKLTLDGTYVYHDFPGDNFKIDHIVVGSAGIFTVESIARSTPANAMAGRAAATVEYDGKMLNFPKEDNYKIIEQAEWQASWLSDWISGIIGEPVAARAIVALPGWFVKRTSADGISVVNPDQFPSLFKHIKPRPLSEENIARIVGQLQQKCRVRPPFDATEGQDRFAV